MRIKQAVRHPVFWMGLVAYAIMFLVTGNITDDDSAASKEIGFSAYILWAQILAALSAVWVAPLLYAVAFSWLLTDALHRRQWPIVLFFMNPFVIVNICDVYNRFLLSLVLATLLAHAVHNARFTVSTAATATLAALHPINVAFVAFTLSPFVAFFLPITFSAFQDIVPWEFLSQLFPDKVQLYQQFGDNISLYSGGNFQIAQEILVEGSTFQKVIASALPGVYTANPLWWHTPLAMLIGTWYTAILWTSRNRVAIALLAVPTIAALSFAVGNSAVLARHFLPLFYLALVLFSPRAANGAALFGIAAVWGRSMRARLDVRHRW